MGSHPYREAPSYAAADDGAHHLWADSTDAEPPSHPGMTNNMEEALELKRKIKIKTGTN